jgi:hypothetical protein
MGGPKTAHTPPLLRMPDFTTLPVNFASLILASCFYGILIVLFVSTIYFLATRRTLAGKTQTSRHHFTSLPFLGVTGLSLVITVVSFKLHFPSIVAT